MTFIIGNIVSGDLIMQITLTNSYAWENIGGTIT